MKAIERRCHAGGVSSLGKGSGNLARVQVRGILLILQGDELLLQPDISQAHHPPSVDETVT